MKKFGNFLVWTMVLSVAFIGCSEEDPPPPHIIVGEWNVEAVDIRTVQFVSGPVAADQLTVSFQAYWGGLYSVDGYYGYDTYTIEFNRDNTFVRTLGQLGPDDIDEGEWLVDDDQKIVTLDLTGTSDEEYELVGDIKDAEMTWSELVSGVRLIYPDAIIADTITDYSFSSQEAFNKISAQVSWEAWIYFER